MPIYEYRCGGCGHEFEEWQKISDKPVKKCPSCAARKVERLVSVSSFHLKGGGWYRDGYGSAKSGQSSTSSGSSGDSGDSDTSSKGTKSKEKGGTKPNASTASA